MKFNPKRRREDSIWVYVSSLLKGLLMLTGVSTIAAFIAMVYFISNLDINIGKNISLPKQMILTYRFDEDFSNNSGSLSFSKSFLEPETSFRDIADALVLAESDKTVKTFVARIENISMSLAQVQELRDIILDFRKSGKKAIVFSESFDSIKSYYLASAFDKIYIQPVGSLSIGGISIEVPFFKDALNKIGVNAEFIRKGRYKNSPESLTKNHMSADYRKSMKSLIDNLSAQILIGISKNRKIPLAELKKYSDNSPYSDDEALKIKLVDGLSYYDDLLEKILKKENLTKDNILDLTEYGDSKKDGGFISSVENIVKEKPDNYNSNKKIALISASGDIVSHGKNLPLGAGKDKIIADEVMNYFNDAIEDKSIAAIVFRLDSPGGSPSASETIRHSILKAQKSGKPVIISMGGYAASGGYWIASAADKIIAEPATITGSIGVFGGKFVLKKLWDKLGVNWGRIKSSKNAGIWSPNKSFSKAERERFNAMLDSIYNKFIKRVMSGRKMTYKEVATIAEGRVWTGSQAKKYNLVDDLGGLDVAIKAAKIEAKIDLNKKITIERFPKQESPLETLISIAHSGVSSLSDIGIIVEKITQNISSLRRPELEMPRLNIVR